MLAAAPPVPLAVAFRDPVHGVATTSSGLEATADGGRTWTPVARRPWRPPLPVRLPSPCPRDLATESRSGDWALCTGEAGAGGQGKAVYRWRSGRWRRVASTPFPARSRGSGGIPAAGYAEGISMAPDGFGIVWESRGTLYVTRDGGSRWTGLPAVAVPEVDFGLSGCALPHGVAFVLLARENVHRRLLETTDAGRTWRVVHRWGRG